MFVIQCKFFVDRGDNAVDNIFFFTDRGETSGNLEGSGDDFSDVFADAMMIADRATARRILAELRADSYYEGSQLSVKELVIEE